MASKKNSLPASKGAIKKTLVRNVEVPISKSKNRWSVVKHSARPELFEPQPSTSKNCHGSKYQVPELNTALDLVKEMKNLAVDKPKTVLSTIDLTPKSRAVVNQEVTKRLNFPPDKAIFNDLISINVNDSILIPNERKPVRTKYTPRTSKDPVPELADFLTPIEPLSHVIPLYDRPLIIKNSVKNIFPDILEIHSKYYPDL